MRRESAFRAAVLQRLCERYPDADTADLFALVWPGVPVPGGDLTPATWTDAVEAATAAVLKANTASAGTP